MKFKSGLKFILDNVYVLVLFALFIVVLLVNIKINFFRYNNFDFGKFDLGNMNQMIWNTMHGRFMYLTDYFGTNLPRWSMSHVDPILLLFLPLVYVFPHPMTITYAQIVLILLSCFLVYKITLLELKSKFASMLLGASFLFYPAIGYITAYTGFHGVSAAIPFFFAAFYVFERMYKDNKFTKKGWLLFWVLLVVVMSGKEQLPLYVILYGIFILIFRNPTIYSIKHKFLSTKWFEQFLKSSISRHSLSMIFVGILWFVLAFFVLIPIYAPYRVLGFEKFKKSLDISSSLTRDVALDNYFLARYEAFGDTYSEVILNMLLRPNDAIKIFFGGDRPDNLNKTFGPLFYMPLAYPTLLMLAIPDLMINYLTSADGVGTSEITNHRISMIIPVLFISTIYAIGYLSSVGSYLLSLKLKNSVQILKKSLVVLLSLLVLGSNIYMTFYSNNPVFLWLDQAIRKKVFAKTISDEIVLDKLKIGEVVRLSELEEKDRECASKIVNMIPEDASVSGPDYLGAHLSFRETYAIFPALYNEADYVIVDVFSKKLLSILDINVDLSRDVVETLIKSSNYKLVTGCGNLFVFKKVDHIVKPQLLPLQERSRYKETMNLPIFQSLHIVDYKLPKEIQRESSDVAEYVFIKRDNNSLNDYVTFTTLVNTKTKDMYQMAHLPSYSISKPGEWSEDMYYVEDVEIAIPEFLEIGTYKLFVGLGNNIRTRSLYLGEVNIY